MLNGACCAKDAVGSGNFPAETIHATTPAVSFKQDPLEKFELEVERRLNALDVRMAKLQTLELRVAKLEDSLDGGHRGMDDTRDVNEGIISTDVVEIITNRGSTKSVSAEVLEDSEVPTSSQAINPGKAAVPLLQESFWDAIFVLGLGGLGMTTTFLVMVGTLVSICSQSVFCWIVFSAFLTPDAKYDAAWLVDWRLLVGHSINGYDANSDSSLVSRACRGKPFDREWWTHSLLNEIDDYLTPMFSEKLTVGSILSSMAVAIWLAYIAKELQRVATLTMNLCAVPKGPTLVVDMHHARGIARRHSSSSSITSAAQASSLRHFHSISTARRSFLLLTLLVRAVLAALLGFCGGLWLCRTRDIENIIQNGVALVFVLEIDELFFELFAPLHASRFVISIARYEQSTKAWVYNLASVLQLLAYLGICWCFVWFEVVPNTDSATEVRDIICSGNQDFIIESHTKVGPIFVTDTSPFEDGNLDNKMLPGMLGLLRQVSQNYKPEEAVDWMWRSSLEGRGEVAVKHTPTVRDFNGWLTMDQFQVADQSTYGFGNWFGNTCEDQGRDFWEGDWLWSTATALTGATDCAGAQPFCGQRDLVLIRMLCPQTCKCDTAIGGQFLSNGCRLGCTQEPSFLDSPCKDFSEDEVENKESWTYFWDLFYSNNKGFWLEDHPLMVFAKNGSNGNCSVLTSESWMLNEFCFHFHNDWVARRPLTAFCPETCGCLQQPRPESPISTSLGLWCPSTC